MPKYLVEGSYIIPEWFEIELHGETEEEVAEAAIKHFSITFPEAEDIEVIRIKVLN